MSPAAIDGLFVTGTDTGVGKTWVSLGLMALVQRQGLRVLGMKPIAAGSQVGREGLLNDDALSLRAQATHEVPYADVNPYAFELPVAPHLAAARAGVSISVPAILASCSRLRARADFVVVEGAGGWYVPLNERETIADLAVALDLPVVLVVGLRLGCLNHALLSAAAIAHSGLPLAGWVASHVDPQMLLPDENLASLRARLPAPCLGSLPWLAHFSIEQVLAHLDLPGSLP